MKSTKQNSRAIIVFFCQENVKNEFWPLTLLIFNLSCLLENGKQQFKCHPAEEIVNCRCIPCALVPFCVPKLKVTEHYCSNCDTLLGKYKGWKGKAAPWLHQKLLLTFFSHNNILEVFKILQVRDYLLWKVFKIAKYHSSYLQSSMWYCSHLTHFTKYLFYRNIFFSPFETHPRIFEAWNNKDDTRGQMTLEKFQKQLSLISFLYMFIWSLQSL